MVIGLDLDNTIICYDRLFASVAREMGLIPGEGEVSKSWVKAEVMGRFGNDVWTELQGHVYGSSLHRAVPFPGVEDVVRSWRAGGYELVVISHKTRFPALGPRCDLREAALVWLEARGWFEPALLGAASGVVEFHDSRSEKVAAIARRGCKFFVDDLPEVFAEPGFPDSTRRVLFDPSGIHASLPDATVCRSWHDILPLVS